MGCVNGAQNKINLKSQIKNMFSMMTQYEEKINAINQQFLVDLKKVLKSDEYHVDENIIVVLDNKSECETVCSQQDSNNKKEHILIQQYLKQTSEQNAKIKLLVNQALFYIQNYSSIQKISEYLVLKQKILKYLSIGFSFKIYSVQQINKKQYPKVNLETIGSLCESIIIQ
ncbi:hypothetical protein ABPG74_021058 [Tetrahymena malaccensis]